LNRAGKTAEQIREAIIRGECEFEPLTNPQP